jgi:hypothetical protein
MHSETIFCILTPKFPFADSAGKGRLRIFLDHIFCGCTLLSVQPLYFYFDLKTLFSNRARCGGVSHALIAANKNLRFSFAPLGARTV